MKQAVLLLSALCVALLAMLVVRSQRAGAQLAAAQTAGLSWSNQWSETQLKVNHQERMKGVLQDQVAERDARLTAVSNAMVLAQASLATARAELQAARAPLPAVLARNETVAAERDAFSNRVREVEAVSEAGDRALREARALAAAAEAERAALSQRLAAAQRERARLEQQLNDPQSLQAHLVQARIRLDTNSTGAVARRMDYRQPLTLQADGSVVLQPLPSPSSD